MSDYWKKKLKELEQSEEKAPVKSATKSATKNDYWGSKLTELEKENERKKQQDIAPVKKTTTKKTDDDDGSFGSWLGNSAMSGLAMFNKGITSTADLLLGKPLQALGWENNPISKMADYYSDSYDVYKKKSTEEAKKIGSDKNIGGMGNEYEVAGALLEGTVAAAPTAIMALMSGGASLTGSASSSLATTAAYRSGNFLTKAGLTAEAMAKNPQYWLSFAQTYGNDYEDAVKSGVDEDVALYGTLISSLVNAGVEIGIDGGSGIQGLPNKVAEGGKSAIFEWVQSSLEEGAEEVLQGVVTRGMNKIMGGDETVFDGKEMLIEGAMGTAVGGILGGGQIGVQSTINSVQQAQANKLTETEQKVVDKVVETRITEEELAGKPVTATERKAIEKQVRQELEDGDISIETIEEVLGGDAYKAYHDDVAKEDILKKEFEMLGGKETYTLADQQRYAELKQQLEELKTNSQRDQLRSQLDDVMRGYNVQDTRLAESYNERARRGQTYEADLSQYDAKQQKVIQKAIDSGILNNTRKTHRFVDLIARIAADKGVSFDFTDNDRLKESGFAVQGATVNGFVDDNGNITLNINSSKALNTVVGHEITHILEDTPLYKVLQDTIFEYAQSRGEYESRLEALTELYKGKKGYEKKFNPKVRKELTADLVGDYLFTDTDFIRKLSTEHRNVFQRLYDEIKYLCKIATAGSAEARELEKVKKAFEDAYRADSKASGNTKYSMSDNSNQNELLEQLQAKRKELQELSVKQDEIEDSTEYNDLIKAIFDSDDTQEALAKYNEWDEKTGYSKIVEKTKALAKEARDLADLYDKSVADGYAKEEAEAIAKSGLSEADYFRKQAVKEFGYTPYFYDAGYLLPNGKMLNFSGEKGQHYGTRGQDHRAIGTVYANVSGSEAMLKFMGEGNIRVMAESPGIDLISNIEPTTEQYATISKFINSSKGNGYFSIDFTDNNGNVVGNLAYEDNFSAVRVINDIKQYYKTGELRRQSDLDRFRYSLTDNTGKQLSKGQQDYFKDSKMRDDDGNLMVMYHGSQDAGFHTFDAKFSDDDTSFFFVDRNDVAASYSGTTESYEARTMHTAEDVNNFIAEIGAEGYEVVEQDGKFVLLYEGDNVATSDTAKGIYDEFRWYEGVGEGDANYKVYLNLTNPLIVDGKGRPWNKIDAEFSQEVYDKYNSLTAEEKAALVDLAEWEDFRIFNSEIQEARGNELASAYAKMGEDVNIYDLFSVAADNFSEEAMRENARHYLKTRDYAQRAHEQGYDGVIFKNIVDNGGYSNGSEGASTVAIAFDSKQIKSTANVNPTEDADIRFSLSKPVEESKNLMALHNLTEEKLLKSLELGGLPMPSIAITKASIPHDNFGNITMIFPKNTVDPKANRKNVVYSADAWTPTFPQVEYEADSNVGHRINGKLRELAEKVEDPFKRDLNLLQYAHEDNLNHFGGEDGLVKHAMGKYGLKAAYLEEQGNHIGNITKQVEVDKGFNSANEAKYQAIADILGVSSAEEIGKMPFNEAKENHGEALEAIYPGMTKSVMRMSGVFKQVMAYLTNNDSTPTYKTVTDESAMRKAVDDALDEAGFEAWTRELFAGIVKDKGIYNHKDLFTPSGNRRSFKQTHLPFTLENIVKAMAAQNNGNTKNVAGFNGIKSLRAGTAERFKSIEAMHKSEGRLQHLTQEEADKINDDLQDRLYAIIHAIDDENGAKGESNSFIRFDIIGETLMEISESGKYNVADIQQVFSQYGREVSDATAADFKQLLYDVSQMPVNIYEAKPERAVGFDEVGVFVIPRNADVKLKQELLNRGYSIAEYDPDVEGDRQKVVNQFEEYKFSLSNVGAKPKTYGNYNVYGKDIALAPVQDSVQDSVQDIAPVQETTKPMTADDMISAIQDKEFELRGYDRNAVPYAPATADEAEQMGSDAFRRIRDTDAPPEVDAPYYGESRQERADDPFLNRDWDERTTKAFTTDNPDAKPFFQEAAERLAEDFAYTQPAERGFSDELYYNTNGEQGFYGWSRKAADDINTLIDVYGLSYAQITEGLDAIINDTPKVNNKPAKTIEFILNDRMLKGTKMWYSGEEIPPHQGYIDWLNGQKHAEEYRDIASTITDADAPMDIAPVAESLTVEDVMPIAENIAPVPKTAERYEAIRPQNTTTTAQTAVAEDLYEDDEPQEGRAKQRKWVGTSTESEAVNREILPDDLDQDAIHYQPIPNKVTLGNANSRLNSMGYDAALTYFNSQFVGKKVTLDDIALGERLIQEAIKRGDKKTAGELIQNVSILGTELGQKVQALSIIKKLTPEGQLKMLQKLVERGKAKGDKSYDGVEVTQDMVDDILGAYDKDGSYDQDKLNEAVDRSKQKLADKMPVTFMEKVNAWRYLSMLGNPKTHIRNLVSNVAMKGTVAVKNALARTVEDIAPIKNRTKTWKPATDYVKSFADKTAVEMQDVLQDGGKYSEEASIKAKRKIFKSKMFGWLNVPADGNSNLLSKEDWWFSKPAFKNAFAEFLTANGIRTEKDVLLNPETVEKARQYATEQSQIATFRQYSWLANKINEIEQKNAATQIAVGAILPFKKTPINIAKTGLSYSPLGFAKTLTYDVAQVKNGKMEASELVDHLAQNVTGTALTLLGYMLASTGFLAGGGSDDKEGKYDYQLGKQSYAVNIGGKTYSLSWLSPVAMPLFVGANAFETLVEKEEWDGDVVVQTLAETLDPLSEMSFLSGLDSVLSSYESGIGKFVGIGEAMTQNYATQFIPTLSSQVATVLDNKKRSTKASRDSGWRAGEETLNKMLFKIPGLRNTLEPSTDIWGNDIKQTENKVALAMETFIAPYAVRENTASAIDEEIKALYSEVGDNGLLPAVPYNYLNYKDERYDMSADDFTAYKKTYGQTAYNMLGELFDTNTYRGADAETKADLVNKVYAYARDEANREYLLKQGVQYTNATEEGVEIYREDAIKGAIYHDVTPEEYTFMRKYPEKYDFFKENGISYEDYDSADEDGKRAYTWAYENPKKVPLAKAIAGDIIGYRQYTSDLYDIKADKDENGESISGSAKEKKLDYINGLDLDYGQKIILFRSYYDSKEDKRNYNRDIVEYLDSRDDISWEEMKTILEELDFTVYDDGRITW